MPYELREADAVALFEGLDEHSLDAVIADPPYGIGFMGREWDNFRPSTVNQINERRVRRDVKHSENPNLRGRRRWTAGADVEYDRRQNKAFGEWTEKWATAALRALKPGAYLIVCCSPRTFHRVGVGVEDAGYEIRDSVAWIYGQGFPKSLDLGDGKGTALKPAHEPVLVARAPLDGTTQATHEKHGTAAVNLDDCLLPGPDGDGHWSGDDGSDATSLPGYEGGFTRGGRRREGRWPPNVVIDDQVAAHLDATVGERRSGGHPSRRTAPKFRRVYSAFGGQPDCGPARGGEVGPVSRFFYCAKASREEREAGCEHLPLVQVGRDPADDSAGKVGEGVHNHHPTVKPVALMRWLVRLFVPAGGLVCDPFVGSGTTGVAAVLEERRFVGGDREPEYVAIAEARLRHHSAQGKLFATSRQMCAFCEVIEATTTADDGEGNAVPACEPCAVAAKAGWFIESGATDGS